MLQALHAKGDDVNAPDPDWYPMAFAFSIA
jgi:hypothetical protein